MTDDTNAPRSKSTPGNDILTLRDASVCHDGTIYHHQTLRFSPITGLILSSSLPEFPGSQDIDIDTSTSDPRTANLPLSQSDIATTIDQDPILDDPAILLSPDDIIAPGLIELQTNGLCGIHFTSLTKENHESALERVSIEMARNGVTGWYATVPTVEGKRWSEILPLLRPRSFDDTATPGSPLLGAHVEGPYLHPLKKGAHDDSFFKNPSIHAYHDLYGEDNLRDVIKYITIAPELDGALDMIRDIRVSYPEIVIALGHSTATYEQGVQGLQAGATSLTHIFNAMNPLHHRDPGLAGTIGIPVTASVEGDISTSSVEAAPSPVSPYFTMIPDLVHLHPSILNVCYHSNPSKCILITDSIELAGLPDGIYPPNGQITYSQRKQGNRATNVVNVSTGEKETLIGSCITLPEGVRNMAVATGVGLPAAVRCASANVADLMCDESRGKLVVGRRADFVVLDREGHVKQTWIGGRKVFEWGGGRDSGC